MQCVKCMHHFYHHKMDHRDAVVMSFVLSFLTDLHNRITLPDVCQELVAQALARAGSFHQASYVYKLYAGWH